MVGLGVPFIKVLLGAFLFHLVSVMTMHYYYNQSNYSKHFLNLNL
jgi:hypothetical protein